MVFFVGKWLPGCQNKTKVLLAGADAVFDLLYLLVAILFTEKDSFAETLWVAPGVVVPLICIARAVRDISDTARNHIMSEEWREGFV